MSSFSLYTLLTLTFSFYLYSALALEPGDYYIYVDAANRALGTAHETGSIVEMLPLGAPLQHVRTTSDALESTNCFITSGT